MHRAKVLKIGLALILAVPVAWVAAIELCDLYGRNLPLFSEGVLLLENSSVVKKELGGPIREGWPVRVSHQSLSGVEYTVLAIPVSGSQLKGTLNVRGRKVGDVWQPKKISVDVLDGDIPSISLMHAE